MDTSRMEKESRNRSTVGQEDSRISHQDDAGHHQDDGRRKLWRWIVGQETRGQSCHGRAGSTKSSRISCETNREHCVNSAPFFYAFFTRREEVLFCSALFH